MSLVGTRPPTVDEWDKYELHHRARLATKPGLKGIYNAAEISLNAERCRIYKNRQCLFFVNTPNSVNAQDAENPSKTASPWIYSELLMATEFPHEKLSKYREGESYEERGYFEHAELQINYDIKIDKLTELYFSDLKKMKFKDETQDPLKLFLEKL